MMADIYTIKTSSKYILFYEDDNAEMDQDALLQKIAEEKTQQLKEKAKKPNIDKSDKPKSKVEPAKSDSISSKVVKKDLSAENQIVKSPEKKFEAPKSDGRPPRFANKKGGSDQQNKENITSSNDEWGTSGNDWGTSDKAGATSNDNQVSHDDWTTSSASQKSGGQGRGGGGNRRGGGFGEFNGPRAPRVFEGRGSRGRGNFNRGNNFGGGFNTTSEVGVDAEKTNDLGDNLMKSEDQQQTYGSRGGYRGGRGGYRREDAGEGGEFRPRGRGRGRGRGNFGSNSEEGFDSGHITSFGNNAKTGDEWGTSENVTETVASGETFDQQQTSNFGRGGRRNFGGGGFRGGRGGRGNFGKNREFDRHSGSDRTGVKAVDRKDGAGTGNWGTAEDDLKAETDTAGFENTEPVANWDADESHDDNRQDKAAVPEPTLMTLDEYKAKKKAQEAITREQVRSTQNDPIIRAVNDGFKEGAFKNMYEYRKAKESEEESSEDEETEDKDATKQTANKEVLFDFKFNDNDRRGGAPGSGGFRGGRGGFGRSGRGGGGNRGEGGNFRSGRGGGRNRDDGESSHSLPAANIRLDDETDFPTLKGK